MRERRAGHNVADGEDVRYAGPALTVDLDEALVGHLYANRLQPQFVRVRTASHGDETYSAVTFFSWSSTLNVRVMSLSFC